MRLMFSLNWNNNSYITGLFKTNPTYLGSSKGKLETKATMACKPLANVIQNRASSEGFGSTITEQVLAL
jgi:hypothetical protein